MPEQSITEVIESIYPKCKESPLCCYPPLQSGYCFRHEKKEAKKAKKINPVSEKRKKANVKLAAIVSRIKKERPVCEMRVPGICQNITVTVHHKAGRVGELLLDEKLMMASCSPCNMWVESNDADARKMGLKVSRIT